MTLDVGDPIEHVRRLGGKIGDAKPSMLLDFEAGRRCEIDAINGSIPRLGQSARRAHPGQRHRRRARQGARARAALEPGCGTPPPKVAG